jgi:hypothetical protein
MITKEEMGQMRFLARLMVDVKGMGCAAILINDIFMNSEATGYDVETEEGGDWLERLIIIYRFLWDDGLYIPAMLLSDLISIIAHRERVDINATWEEIIHA